MKISVITPTLDEESSIIETIETISRLVNVAEIIIVDGGSKDKTLDLVDDFETVKELKVVRLGQANRGAQLHEGTKHAQGDIYWFIHADSRPVQGSGKQILKFMHYSEVVGGNFEVLFSGQSRSARFITWLYPHLRTLGLVYGDSAFFVRKEVYDEIGGFRDYPLFEDVEFYKKLKKRGKFVQIRMPVTVSSRRFANRSFVWTFTKWSLRQGLYWIGVPPRLLGKTYRKVRGNS